MHLPALKLNRGPPRKPHGAKSSSVPVGEIATLCGCVSPLSRVLSGDGEVYSSLPLPPPAPVAYVMPPTGGEIPDHRWRVVHRIGLAFLIGAPCGGAFHFVRGALSAPTSRLAAGAQAARAHTPRVAGRWGSYYGVWCAFEGAASRAREKEDP